MGAIDDIKKRFANIRWVLEPILDQWPSHASFINQSFTAHDDAGLDKLDALAADIKAISRQKIDSLLEGYRWMCDAFLEEEIHFRRTGEYRCKSYDQARKEVYSDSRIMNWYMDGLLLSQLLWSNHAQAYLFFTNSFLPSLPSKCDYLEIGCGHGLYIARAARDADCRRLTGWDISIESLRKTKAALGCLGLSENIRLVIRDAMKHSVPASQDAIVISEVLEHLEDPAGALNNLRRQVRPGGLIFVNMPINSPAPDHIFLLRNPEEVEALVRSSGFEIIQRRAIPMTGYTLERALKTKSTVTCIVIGRNT